MAGPIIAVVDPELEMMRRHWSAIEAAISRTPNASWLGFIEQRAALMAADGWVRSLSPPRNPELAMSFNLAVAALLLGVEDIIRIWPDDPAGVVSDVSPTGDIPAKPPVTYRFGELTGHLLREMRDLLADPDAKTVN